MSKKALRSAAAVIVLVATVVAFAVYFSRHPETLKALGAVSPSTVAVLVLLYGLFMATLVWIQRATLDLCDLRLAPRESALLTIYSSIVNFFGPLQSGPGFRAAYLKKRHSVSLKKYALATLIYYGLYAVFSGLFLVSFFFGWWIVAACVAAFVLGPVMLRLPRFKDLRLRHVMSLALATLAQVCVQAVIYFVELHSLAQHITYIQSLTYTGAANFALFVSLTPGAIGFRESFLLFSEKLHHVSSSVIATASVIDRGSYVLLLVIMAALIFSMHAHTYFKNVKAD